MRVHWIGPINDSSGYASATRNYIVSLIQSKQIDLSVEAISFEKEKTSHRLNPIIAPFIRSGLDRCIRILHMTPENYPRFISKDSYNIGYTAWEARPIPIHWIDSCNLMNEIWVPSEWNVKVFKESGVKCPVYCIPHGISISPEIDKLEPMKGIPTDKYCFYSIFQWTARKNPVALLIAYLTEFRDVEDVLLIIKTYRKNTSEQEREFIRNDIRNVKTELHLPRLPAIAFFGDLLTTEDLYRLHKRGDCFVLPTRGEGFGIPFMEAMAFGKPTIGPNYGGNIDFMNQDNSYLIDTRETVVFGQSWMPHYDGSMFWGDPSIVDLKNKMRHVYQNQMEAKAKGIAARGYIEKNLSWEKVSSLIIDRLKQIEQQYFRR